MDTCGTLRKYRADIVDVHGNTWVDSVYLATHVDEELGRLYADQGMRDTMRGKDEEILKLNSEISRLKKTIAKLYRSAKPA